MKTNQCVHPHHPRLIPNSSPSHPHPHTHPHPHSPFASTPSNSAFPTFHHSRHRPRAHPDFVQMQVIFFAGLLGLAAAEDCFGDGSCSSSAQFCSKFECTDKYVSGAVCYEKKQCSGDLLCVSKSCGPPLENGEECKTSDDCKSTLCSDHLKNGVSPSVCQNLVPVGGRCTDTKKDQQKECEGKNYCDSIDYAPNKEEGTCIAFRAEGVACTERAQCNDASHCDGGKCKDRIAAINAFVGAAAGLVGGVLIAIIVIPIIICICCCIIIWYCMKKNKSSDDD